MEFSLLGPFVANPQRARILISPLPNGLGWRRVTSPAGASDQEAEKFYQQRGDPLPKKYCLGDFRIFLLRCYRGVNDGFSDNLPFMHVAPVQFAGDEPPVPDQNLGRVDCVLSIPGAARSIDKDLSRADGGLGPVLEPIEQLLRGIFVRLYFGRWGPSEPLK